jgi:transposase-like protein
MKLFLIGRNKKRPCPTCKRLAQITVTNTGDGWERWECHSCGVVREYQVMGRAN